MVESVSRIGSWAYLLCVHSGVALVSCLALGRGRSPVEGNASLMWAQVVIGPQLVLGLLWV